MSGTSALHFGPYRLAGRNGPLSKDGGTLKLKPKALGLLWELVQRPGEVLTKSALHDALWPRAVVGEDALAFQVQALRRALEDDPRTPRYIATIHRVGYCFVADVVRGAQPEPPAIPATHPATDFVGRASALSHLHDLHARVMRTERQVVFVSGEAGIGKSTLVEQFLARTTAGTRVGRGQCVEQHGAGEGYLPVLEALGSLCRQPQGADVLDVLRQAAPTWLMQMPALLTQQDIVALQPRTAGSGRERMLREIADALELLTAQAPLILVLEDLHWSDPSTFEMLAMVARRRAPARLLLIGTFRHADVASGGHPLRTLKQELGARGLAAEIPLGNLARSEVETYVGRRFSQDVGADASLVDFVYRRTGGHPLFMVQVSDVLAGSGVAGAMSPEMEETLDTVIPQGLRELIEAQLGRLTDEERLVLATASAAGAEFAVASVGAAARLPTEVVETCCDGLARRGAFLEDRGFGTWPDGTSSGRFGFRHALYQDVLYAQLSPRRRAQAHLAIGSREAAAHGERCAEIAAELAVHFERGLDPERAVLHCHQAAENALQRSANAEAIGHFSKALSLLETLPATAVRTQLELRLQVGLSFGLTMTKGYSAPEVEHVTARAQALCERMEETPEISSALFRIGRFHLVRGEIRTARALGERLLRIARRAGSPALLSQAHTAAAFETFSLGDFQAAQEHADKSIANDDLQRYRSSGAVSADDSSAVSYTVRAFALQICGFSDQAQVSMQKSTMLARALELPFATGGALLSTTDLHFQRRDSRAVQAAAVATIVHAEREAFPYYVARARVLRGWALADQGQPQAGLEDIRQGLAMLEGMGSKLWGPCCLGQLAEARARAGDLEGGIESLDEALDRAARTGEQQYEAELHRLKGELLMRLSAASTDPAETSFQRAIAIARHQRAKTYELRAAVARVQARGRSALRPSDLTALAEITDGFTEGLDSRDLHAARALLANPAVARPA